MKFFVQKNFCNFLLFNQKGKAIFFFFFFAIFCSLSHFNDFLSCFSEKVILSAFSISLSSHSSSEDEKLQYMGCEGYVLNVDGSIFNESIADLSVLYVILVTQEGFIKEKQHCMPNGYYFIPLPNDKRSYKLRIIPPKGWIFNPSEFDVHGECKHDLNFVFSGFSISDRVMSLGEESNFEGLENLSVILRKDNKIFAKVKTKKGGFYSFENIPHGEIEIEVDDPNCIFDVHRLKKFVGFKRKDEKEESDLEGEKKQFSVIAYKVFGRVVLPSSQIPSSPLLGKSDVLLYVLAMNEKMIEICKLSKICFNQTNFEVFSKEVNEIPLHERSLLINVLRSNSKGDFSFFAPNGNLEIKILSEKNKKIKFESNVIRANVLHKPLTLQQNFKVTRFEALGRVTRRIEKKGEEGQLGILGVKIFLNGLIRAISDAEGYYFIDDMAEGFYDVQASHEFLKFPSLSHVPINAIYNRFPDINPSEFAICGAVSLHDQFSSEHGEAVKKTFVRVKREKTGFEKIVEVNQGRYCVFVTPGLYTLKAESSSLGFGEKGVLNVGEQSVNVDVKELININFSEENKKILGLIKCNSEGCNHSFNILIKSIKDPSRFSFTALSVLDRDNINRFELPSKISSGEYTIEILDDIFCWERKVFQIKYDASLDGDISIEFIPRGRKMKIKLSHKINFFVKCIKSEVEENQSIVSVKGKQAEFDFCIEEAYAYEIISNKNCFLFEKDPAKIFLNDLNSIINLNISRVLIKGVVFVKKQEENQNFNLYAFVFSSENTLLDKARCTLELREKEKFKNESMYSYRFWLDVNTKGYIKIEEQHSTEEGISVISFPSKIDLQIALDENGCPDNNKYVFHSHVGKKLSGLVYPPTEGVSIVVKSPSMNSIVTEVKTNKQGVYVTKALSAHEEYIVDAFLEGYRIKRDLNSPYNFKLIKLGKIIIKVYENKENSSSSKPLLSSILFSLSSSTYPNYRSRKLSDEKGEVICSNLMDGLYYARPLSKEFVFSPNQITIEIKEGGSEVSSFTGRRVAYSCRGTLRSLGNSSSEDFSSLIVQALDNNGESEEAVVNKEGSYEIRALKTNLKYKIFIFRNSGTENKHIQKTIYERSSPNFREIMIEHEKDVTGVDFFVFFRPSGVNLILEFEDVLKEKNIIQVFKMKDSVKGELSYRGIIGNLPYFEVRNLAPEKYLIVISKEEKIGMNTRTTSKADFSLSSVNDSSNARKEQILYSEVVDGSNSNSIYLHVFISFFSDSSNQRESSSSNLSKSPFISFLLLLAILAFSAKYSGVNRHEWYRQAHRKVNEILNKVSCFIRLMLSFLNIQFVVMKKKTTNEFISFNNNTQNE